MNSVNFTANLVKRTLIPKLCNDGNYSLQDVSIVEFDKNDENDISALRQISYDWREHFSSEIYNEAVKGYEYDNVEKEHYYGVTTQNGDFAHINSNKVLGLMLFSKTNEAEDQVNWLQARPDTKYGSSYREFKGAGSSLINYIKHNNYGKTIKGR